MIFNKYNVEIEFYDMKKTIILDKKYIINYCYIERIESFDKNKGNARKALLDFIKLNQSNYTYFELLCKPKNKDVDMKRLLKFYKKCNFFISEKIDNGFLMINDDM